MELAPPGVPSRIFEHEHSGPKFHPVDELAAVGSTFHHSFVVGRLSYLGQLTVDDRKTVIDHLEGADWAGCRSQSFALYDEFLVLEQQAAYYRFGIGVAILFHSSIVPDRALLWIQQRIPADRYHCSYD